MQRVMLDLDHSNFYCPVTGKLIADDDSFEASPATVFTYVNEVGEFDTIAPELLAIWEQVEAETDEEDFDADPFEIFCQRIEDDSIVCFEITTHGFACGPVSSTVRIAINMNYCNEENEEEEEEDEEED
ncbi:MAG: hypothetical protein ACK6A7_02565 [Planctomycetota bacterium]|jgi:hypothetical protein